jgi:signal transduction histidine kinase
LDGLPGENWEAALEEILRVDSDVLSVESVSYWRFRPSPPAIVCELGYRSSGQSFDRGFELRRTDSPAYFDEIRRHPVLAVEDAIHDDRTRDIRSYLESRRIGALLDTAVRVGGRAVGILCHEHRGGSRPWSEQEQHFAFAVGQIVAARLAARARSRAEEQERRSALLADVMADVAASFGSPAAAARVAVERAIPALGEMALLVAFDGNDLRYVVSAHIHPHGRALLEQHARLHPPRLDGPGIVPGVIREQQSLLVPNAGAVTAREYGLDDAAYSELAALHVRSVVAAPFLVRGLIRGAMVFGSSFRRFDQEDLRFCERYAQRIGLILENGELFEKAQQAVRSRDELVSQAAHELRTPLTSLSLFAQSIAREAAALPAPWLAQVSRGMVRQADRIDRLAERLLSASEMQAGRPTVNRERVDLGELARDVLLAYSGAAAAAGSALRFAGEDHLITNVDPLRIEQALGNLLDNAIKFGAGQPIEIGLRVHGGSVTISVTDHGPGIQPGEEEAIFQPYRRGSAADGLGGLGLGLHVVREIVEAHGGKVAVDARPGDGATFTVELPLDAS